MFWLFLFIMIYTWLGYPLTLLIINKMFGLPVIKDGHTPSVTVLITVHNEEKNIENRLDNLKELDYPEDKLEFLVASDGSTDRTNEMVIQAARTDERIRLLALRGGGKSCAQNQAIPQAKGEVLVLTDADTVFTPETVTELVKPLADDKVGCVSGSLRLMENDGLIAHDQGYYWKYEMMLRRYESRVGMLHTATGAVMAFRKKLFIGFEDRYGDDCIIPLTILEAGKRIVHSDSAVAYDAFPSTPQAEFRTRTRMTLRNITCTLSRPALLNLFRHPMVGWAIIWHKLCRWLTPYFFLGLFAAALINIHEEWYYGLILLMQSAFLASAILGWFAVKYNRRIPIVSSIYSFVLANMGFFVGVLRAVTGLRITRYNH